LGTGLATIPCYIVVWLYIAQAVQQYFVTLLFGSSSHRPLTLPLRATSTAAFATIPFHIVVLAPCWWSFFATSSTWLVGLLCGRPLLGWWAFFADGFYMVDGLPCGRFPCGWLFVWL
jgi:hypothetical protein